MPSNLAINFWFAYKLLNDQIEQSKEQWNDAAREEFISSIASLGREHRNLTQEIEQIAELMDQARKVLSPK